MRGGEALGRLLGISPAQLYPPGRAEMRALNLADDRRRATPNLRWTAPKSRVSLRTWPLPGGGPRREFDMASYAGAVQERSVSIGRVLLRAFGALGSNPVTMFGIAFLFGALPQMLISYGSQMLRVRQTRFELIWSVSVGSGLLVFVLWMLVQGALVRATIAASEGGKASFAESAAAGLSVALPLVALAILSGIATGIGFMLFVVPGVMLALAWAVTTPALVEERLGVFEAFGRSRTLTRGARWKIFGLLLVLVVLYLMVSSVFGVALVAGGMRRAAAFTTPGLSVGWVVFNILFGTLSTAVWSVVQTSLYLELRDWKDGPTIEALEDIFA